MSTKVYKYDEIPWHVPPTDIAALDLDSRAADDEPGRKFLAQGDGGWVWELQGAASARNYVGDTHWIAAEVRTVIDAGVVGSVVVDLTARNQLDEVTFTGTAAVLLPNDDALAVTTAAIAAFEAELLAGAPRPGSDPAGAERVSPRTRTSRRPGGSRETAGRRDRR